MRRLVRMVNHATDECKMISTREDAIYKWVDDILKRWNVTPMHSTEYVGTDIYANSNWFRINLVGVDKQILVSVWVEEY
jgi:hypothetical protein